MQKTEGNITFHTAASTAFPQPKPGAAPSPGPMKVPTDQLRGLLGLTQVNYVRGNQQLAIIDSSLDSAGALASNEIKIDNFSFMPVAAKVASGAEITWTNHDDIPHNVIATDKSFGSPVLDAGEKFTRRFTKPGEYSYYCSIHPKMTGQVIVME